jgi:hypothetical protein
VVLVPVAEAEAAAPNGGLGKGGGRERRGGQGGKERSRPRGESRRSRWGSCARALVLPDLV